MKVPTRALVFTIVLTIITQSAASALCHCWIPINEGKNVPREGFHQMAGTGGTVFLDNFPIATLETLAVNVDLAIDPLSPDISIATVTSVEGFVPKFVAGDSSVWSLGAATGSCANTLFFDFSQPDSDAQNVTGCFVVDASGGISQTGIEVVVDGTNFDPAGVRDINTFGITDKFVFLPFIFGDDFESGNAAAWSSTIP